MRIMFFMENHVVGGGSKYLIDCINASFSITNDVFLVTNENSLAAHEIEKIEEPLQIINHNIIGRAELTRRFFFNIGIIDLICKKLDLLNPILLLLNTLLMYKRICSLKPDLVISCNGGYPAAESCLATVFASRLLNIPSILIVVGQPTRRRWYLPGYDRLLDFFVFRFAKRVIANSDRQLELLRSLRGADEKKLARVYNGISDAAYRKRSFVDCSSTLILGVVCRVDKAKGLDFLVEAVGMVAQKYSIELHIIGEGDEFENIAAQIRELKLTDVVKLLGFISGDIDSHLKSFDIYVFPSLWEGLPYSVLEALREGLPIVSTDVGGIPEALRNMVEAILVEPRSARALADGISLLLEDPQLAERLSKNARLRYEELFTHDKMYSDFKSVINDVAPSMDKAHALELQAMLPSSDRFCK